MEAEAEATALKRCTASSSPFPNRNCVRAVASADSLLSYEGAAVSPASVVCGGFCNESLYGDGVKRIISGHDSVANTERRIGLSGKAVAGVGNEARFRAIGKCDQGENREDS